MTGPRRALTGWLRSTFADVGTTLQRRELLFVFLL